MLTVNRAKIKRLLLILISCIIIVSPTVAKQSVSDSLSRIVTGLIPSVFPMMIISPYLARELCNGDSVFARMTRLPKSLLPSFLVGCVCGYPIPTLLLNEQYKTSSTNKKNVVRAIILFNNASPAFIINYIGSYFFSSAKIGVILYFSQILSVLILSAFLLERENGVSAPTIPYRTLTSQIKTSVRTIIDICAYIVIFSYASDLVITNLNGPAIPLIAGAFEITRGLSLVSGNGLLSYIQAIFMMTIPGLCVYFQIKSTAENIEINFIEYLKIRLCVFVLTVFISLTLLLLLDILN